MSDEASISLKIITGAEIIFRNLDHKEFLWYLLKLRFFLANLLAQKPFPKIDPLKFHIIVVQDISVLRKQLSFIRIFL